MAALTPSVMAATGRRGWFRAAIGYTLAGAATSVLVGTVVGTAGELAGLGDSGTAGIAVALVLALAALFRELGWISFPLPQAQRQTDGRWAHMGHTTAAVLWGLDLGLFATTWLTFAGAWLVPLLALLSGSVGFAVALFTAYWLGRAVSVWVAPAFMRSGRDTSHMMSALTLNLRTAQLVHAAALAWAVSVLVLMAASSQSI